MTDWEKLDTWWRGELAADPSYAGEVRPLFEQLLHIRQGAVVLDLGTGTGWALDVIRACGGIPLGADRNPHLVGDAGRRFPVVLGALPGLEWCSSQSVDGVTAVLVLEHIGDIATLFAEAARITRPQGIFTLVINHPQITAPGSAPVVDPVDGEVFWRWGTYLEPGSTEEPAGEETVTFHHRPIADLLNAAAGAGWILEKLVERGLPDNLTEGDPLLELQRGLPRLLGVRWRRS